MHHPTDRVAHTTAFVTPVVENWLEREIGQWVHPMNDRSDDPSHHERTLLPWSYISLPCEKNPHKKKKKKKKHPKTKPSPPSKKTKKKPKKNKQTNKKNPLVSLHHLGSSCSIPERVFLFQSVLSIHIVSINVTFHVDL